MKASEFSFQVQALIALLLVTAFFPCYGEDAPLPILGSGEPGLKICFKTTNSYVIYLDEPWTVGIGDVGGIFARHIDILFDHNYGLKEQLQSQYLKWNVEQQQLYPFDDQRVFTCDTALSESNNWPHQTQLFSMKGDSISVSDDVYALARQRYGLTTNQFFLGKIGTNIFYWEMGDPRKVFYRPAAEEKAASYFELPKGMIDLFGVTKSVKKEMDVGFTVLKKSTGFFQYSPNEFTFIEVSFKEAKPVKNDTIGNQ